MRAIRRDVMVIMHVSLEQLRKNSVCDSQQVPHKFGLVPDLSYAWYCHFIFR